MPLPILLRLRALAVDLEVPDVCGCETEIVKCITDETPWGCESRRAALARGDPEPLCDCTLIPAPLCEHILASDHCMPFDEWLALMWASDLLEYVDPPRCTCPSAVMSQEARVAVLVQRRKDVVGLWCPGDVVTRGERDLRVAPRISAVESNGRDLDAFLAIDSTDEDDLDDVDDLDDFRAALRESSRSHLDHFIAIDSTDEDDSIAEDCED